MHPHAPRPLSGTPERSQLSAQMNGRLLAAAVQRGSIAIASAQSATATIASIDTANSRVRFLGQTYTSSGDNMDKVFARIGLTNATTVTAIVNTNTATSTATAAFEVSTYAPTMHRRIQRGTFAGGGGSATITAVVVANTELDFLGFSTSTVTTNPTAQLETIGLTNATTITAGVGSGNATISYQASEIN